MKAKDVAKSVLQNMQDADPVEEPDKYKVTLDGLSSTLYGGSLQELIDKAWREVNKAG